VRVAERNHGGVILARQIPPPAQDFLRDLIDWAERNHSVKSNASRQTEARATRPSNPP